MRQIPPMKRVTSTPPPVAKARDWRVAIIRKKLERLGRVAAGGDAEAAEAAAVQEFKLNDEQRKRLVIQPVAP